LSRIDGVNLMTTEREGMNDTIRLAVSRDDDGTGLLTVAFVSGRFSGEGSAYFDLNYLGEVAQVLTSYPLPSDPVVLAGGFFDEADFHVLRQEHVFIQARALAGGPVGLLVRVAEPWEANDALRRSASAEFLLDYEQIGSLARKLQLLAVGQRDSVVLELGPTR
jgi:hypothetical protein